MRLGPHRLALYLYSNDNNKPPPRTRRCLHSRAFIAAVLLCARIAPRTRTLTHCLVRVCTAAITLFLLSSVVGWDLRQSAT